MVTVRLGEDLEQELSRVATEEGRTKTEIIREALRSYLTTIRERQTPYELGQDLFGAGSSGRSDLSRTYKRRLNEKLRERHSR